VLQAEKGMQGVEERRIFIGTIMIPTVCKKRGIT
jgi:hypothetical protein